MLVEKALGLINQWQSRIKEIPQKSSLAERNKVVFADFEFLKLEQQIELLAEQGNAEAFYVLAVGKYLPYDLKKFLEMLGQAALKGYVKEPKSASLQTVVEQLANILIAKLDNKSASLQIRQWLNGDGRDYKTAVIIKAWSTFPSDYREEMEEIASSDKTDPRGEIVYLLARHTYYDDDAKFIEYTQRAVDRGYAPAASNLISYYIEGGRHGITRNYDKAAKLIVAFSASNLSFAALENYLHKAKIDKDVELQNACIKELAKNQDYKNLNDEVNRWFERKFIMLSDDTAPDMVDRIRTDRELEKKIERLRIVNPKAALIIAIKNENLFEISQISFLKDLAFVNAEAAKCYLSIGNSDIGISILCDLLLSGNRIAVAYVNKFLASEKALKTQVNSELSKRKQASYDSHYKERIEREVTLIRRLREGALGVEKTEFLLYIQAEINYIESQLSQEATKSSHYPLLRDALKDVVISELRGSALDSKFIQVRAILEEINTFVHERDSKIADIWQSCKKQLGLVLKNMKRESKGRDEYVSWAKQLVYDPRYRTMGKDSKQAPENIPKIIDARPNENGDVFENIKKIIESIPFKKRKKEINCLYEELQLQLKVEVAALKQANKGEEQSVHLKEF